MIIEHLVSQHAEEAAFLWLLRDDAVSAPHYTLKDLFDLEERIDAHLDGLRVAGDDGWAICEAQLELSEIGEVFTAGYIALDGSREKGLEAVIKTVDAAPETTAGLVSALGWVDKDKLQGRVVNWLNDDTALLKQLGLSACSIQRVNCGGYLARTVDDADPLVRARSLRCIGEIRRHDLSHSLIDHLQDDDEGCRFWSAWSAALVGEVDGSTSLRGFVENLSSYSEPALELALRTLNMPTAVQWLRELSARPELARLVVQGSGYFGDSASVPWLIEKMKTPELARVAGEAFSLITGLDLAYEDLEGEAPEGFEAGPTENPEDEDVEMDTDEDLPWPEPQLIAEWWGANRDRFPSGQRLLAGQTITRDQCLNVLKQGYQRQRRAAAIELAMLSPDEPLFNTAATARRQMQALGL